MLIVFETFRHRDKLAQRLYTQLDLIRPNQIRVRHGHRNQQAYPVPMFNLI